MSKSVASGAPDVARDAAMDGAPLRWEIWELRSVAIAGRRLSKILLGPSTQLRFLSTCTICHYATMPICHTMPYDTFSPSFYSMSIFDSCITMSIFSIFHSTPHHPRVPAVPVSHVHLAAATRHWTPGPGDRLHMGFDLVDFGDSWVWDCTNSPQGLRWSKGIERKIGEKFRGAWNTAELPELPELYSHCISLHLVVCQRFKP